MEKGNKENVITITNQELAGIELSAMKRPTTTGAMAPRVVRCFIEYIAATYGVDLMIETEDMKDERLKREAKESRKKYRLRRQLGRKSPRGSADDF